LSVIDYKDVRRLKGFVSERGKITPRRISGSCARHQRPLTRGLPQVLGVVRLHRPGGELDGVRADAQRSSHRDGENDETAHDRQIEKIIEPAAQDVGERPDVVQPELKKKLRGEHECNCKRHRSATPQRSPDYQLRANGRIHVRALLRALTTGKTAGFDPI